MFLCFAFNSELGTRNSVLPHIDARRDHRHLRVDHPHASRQQFVAGDDVIAQAAEHLELVPVQHKQTVVDVQHNAFRDPPQSLFDIKRRIAEEFAFEHNDVGRPAFQRREIAAPIPAFNMSAQPKSQQRQRGILLWTAWQHEAIVAEPLQMWHELQHAKAAAGDKSAGGQKREAHTR